MRVRIAFPAASLLAALLLIGAGAPLARAQSRPVRGAVDGVVTDTNLVSLSDATVSVLGSGIQVVTGANGRFRILGLPTGQYFLVVHRLGYVPASAALQVGEQDTLRMSFALARVVTALDTVVVAAKPTSMRMAEFEERRKQGFGQFMTQAQIEQRNSVMVADLLRTFLSVNVSTGAATNLRFGGVRACAFQFFIDGVAIPTPKLADLPSPKEIAGIEVYSGAATIPLQYKTISGAFCGVILLWTRGGN